MVKVFTSVLDALVEEYNSRLRQLSYTHMPTADGRGIELVEVTSLRMLLEQAIREAYFRGGQDMAERIGDSLTNN
jgi:two-component sensor histidine kinase